MYRTKVQNYTPPWVPMGHGRTPAPIEKIIEYYLIIMVLYIYMV